MIHVSNTAADQVLKLIEQARGLPNLAYTNEAFFIHERDQVFAQSWVGLWFAGDLPHKGDVTQVDFMGLPFIIVRNWQDEIKVFHNVCSHRGMRLVRDQLTGQRTLRCPYHAWSYSLDGDLKGTPHLGGIGKPSCETFNRGDHGLKQVRSMVWMDIIFINLSDQAPSFAAYAEPLTQRWQAFVGSTGLDQLRMAPEDDRIELEVATNWKLAVENYCESYHLPWIHPSLNTYSRLEDHYHIMIGDDFSGQGSLAYRLSDDSGAALPRIPTWPHDQLKQAEYVAFYPNVLLGIHVDHAFSVIINPLASGQSAEHLRLYYVGDDALLDAYADSRQMILESWRTVFSEDIEAVEGMQQGRLSPGYDGGVFSPFMDNPTHHFHQWVARKLKAASPQSS